MDMKLSEREHLLMEAAMLIWQSVEPDYYPRDNSNPPEPYLSAREFGGIQQLRLDAREAAPYLDAAHDLFEEVAGAPPGEFGLAYDFEFAPWFCETCLHPDFAGAGAAFGVYDDWRGLVTEYARRVKGKDDEEMFKRYATAAFKYLWGCEPDVVECDLDRLAEDHLDPKVENLARAALDAVENWGRDLDLSSTDPMMKESFKRSDWVVRDLLTRAAE